MHSTKLERQQVPLASRKGQVLSEVKHVKIDYGAHIWEYTKNWKCAF